MKHVTSPLSLFFMSIELRLNHLLGIMQKNSVFRLGIMQKYVMIAMGIMQI